MDTINKAELAAALYVLRIFPDLEAAKNATVDVFEAVTELRKLGA